ncbi:MAG: hypothetical protein AB7I27_18400 [Bacteriovoracaceae bacterium]
MLSRFKLLLKITGMCALTVLLVSCQDTVPQRDTITPDNSTTTGDGTDTGTDATKTSRPTGAISFKSDYCGCKDGKPVTYGDCTSFCSTKNTSGEEVLYINFTVTEAISLGGLGNVYNWCTKPMTGDTSNPKCLLEVKDEEGNTTNLDVTNIASSNSITSKILSLEYDKTYVMSLVESVSGSRSDTVQFIKFSSPTVISTLGPLKNAPISQYTCLIRDFSTDENTGDIYYNKAYRVHFYYHPRIPPTPVPAGTANLICHDIFNPLYGSVDDELYPRLENSPGIFNLWDTTDPRFYDNNGNSILDVNDQIFQKTKNFGGSIPSGTNFFSKFTWPGSPQMNEDAGNSNSPDPIGYFMSPWIDQTTFKSYCLNSTYYNSNNALFKAFRDILQVDTEGLYIGEKAAETVTNSSGQTTTGAKDYILIRETDLKQVWFYLKNGVPTVPTDDIVANVQVYFYYPLNKTSPYIQTSTQRIYRVKGASELNVSSTPATSTGTTTSYPPHDRKIGCVPKF